MTTSEILDQIKIYDADLTKRELHISYDFKGEAKHLTLIPEKAARLFKMCGFISGSAINDGDLIVSFEYEGTGGVTHIAAIEWEEFVLSFNLSQYKALQLIAHWEKEKSEKKLISNVKRIPGLLDKIVGEFKAVANLGKTLTK